MRISDWSSDVCSSDLVDLHVAFRLQPGKADHPAGDVHDLDRLTHVEDEYTSPPHAADQCPRRALQNELHRLMDGHEIAPDIGMGDGQRTAATKLPLEKRYQRPAGADDVAEKHSEETRRLRIVLPLQIQSLAKKFAKPPGRPPPRSK